ncbi:MAG: pentapeptide repeat-containing protein [Sphaerospermopsis kisseleviana]
MANPEHLAILKQGIGVWNKWIEENQDVIPDLSSADLCQANLRDADLRDANLRDANLRDANLCQATLSNADLSNADLVNANLIRAKVQYADLSGANLSGADLSGARLDTSDLSRANLSGANLGGANLANSQVIGTNFDNATLTGCSIKDWLISSKTNLDKVICEYVYLSNTSFYRQTQKRPINGNYAPGEFASLYKKIIETTDLILSKTTEIENTVNKPEKNIDVDNTSNNQGVKFYSNSTIHTWERLRFRSKTEIKIAEALDRTGVLFVPNSLARLTTSKGRENKEADFLICYNGKWGVLEVDGPFHTAERRVEEQERERIFKKNGIKVVERFDAQRCYNNPDEVVQEFFKMIEIGYS